VPLLSVSATNIRNIADAHLDLSPDLTLIWGPNGAGKTSVLEAIFLLGRGRSFRTRNTERLISRGADHLRATGVIFGGVQPSPIGIEVRAKSVVARVAGRTVESLAELSQAFPVQVIEPGIHRLVEEGGHRRRRWVDWAVFHVEPHFVDTWVRYGRSLKQRNAALRTRSADAALWEPELARLGELISASRAGIIESLQPYWMESLAALTSQPVELHYTRGWSAEQTLAGALEASRVRDAARGLTHPGPHRGDISLRLHGRPAREVLSRGQQKLTAVAMTLAQLQLLRDRVQTTPTLLLDDPAAELDGAHLAAFISQVRSLRCQLVVTSLTPESQPFGAPERTFQMDQGRVLPV